MDSGIARRRRRPRLARQSTCTVLVATVLLLAGAAPARAIRTHSVANAPVVLQGASRGRSSDSRVGGIVSGLRRTLTALQARTPSPAGRRPRSSLRAAAAASTAPGLDVRRRASTGTPMQIRAGAPSGTSGGGALRVGDAARAFLREHRGLLGIDDPDRELVARSSEADALGRRRVRYAQTFEGLDVWPAELNVHLDASGAVDLLDGAFVRTPSGIDLQPAVSADRAMAVARGAVPGGDGAAIAPPALILHAPLDAPTRLAWKVDVPVSLPSDWRVVVDAQTAEVLTAYNQVPRSDRAGSGVDLFGKTRPLRVWEEGPFYLVDTSKTMFDPSSDPPQADSTRGGIVILDAHNQPPTSEPESIPDLFLVDALSADGPWLRDGVSAAYGLSQTYDYYLERHGRNSIDGRGGTLLGIVRFGKGLDNAFWSNGLMLFGDAVPFAGALDVIAHEMTHGVTERTAELIYQDQPGALNEAMSDIFGENVEARTMGGPDWLKAAQIASPPYQNYADCPAVAYAPGVPHPSRMSEFVQTGQDNGGVHGNSCIINHAYYLLAAGLPGAIGLGDAEKIFYRALTVHLVRNSQFIDARLAAVQSAVELFGADSAQVQRTKEAFDAVEIFEGEPTDPPPPFPEVSGPDAVVFVYRDALTGDFYLGRREAALDDPVEGVQLSVFPVKPIRPSVSGDGEVVVYVDATGDVCLIPTAAGGDEVEQCLGVPDAFHSVSISPDSRFVAAVLIDPDTRAPEHSIHLLDLQSNEDRTVELGAPLIDGERIGTVEFAEILDFSADSKMLVYDAFNRIPVAGGDDLGLWSVYAYDLGNDRILSLVEPEPDVDVGNPSLAQTSDSFMAVDVLAGQATRVVTVSLQNGDATEVAAFSGAPGVPGYTGEDAALVFAAPDEAAPGGFSLVRQELADRQAPTGPATTLLSDAGAGVIYRRGAFQGPASTATPTSVVPTPTPTRTVTAAAGTATPTPSRTATAAPNTTTPTRTATSVLPTASATATATVPRPACVADCRRPGEVHADDLLLAIRILLGEAAPSACAHADGNGDGRVRVEDLVAAVASALHGCVPAS